MLTTPAPYRNNMLWEQSRGDSWSWSEMYHVLNVLKWRSNWSMISWLDIRWSSHHITTRDWRHHHYQMRPGGPQVTTEASLYFYIIPPDSQYNKSISIPWVEQSVSPKGSSATESITKICRIAWLMVVAPISPPIQSINSDIFSEVVATY